MIKIDVIKHLLENKAALYNIRLISKELKIDYKNTYENIRYLENKGILDLVPFGNSVQIRLKQKIHPLIYEAEYERQQKLLKNKNLLVMLDYFKNIKSRFFILLVFGSYAKGKQSTGSDIDLMFIVPDRKETLFEKEVFQLTRSLPLPVHSLVFSEKQFLEMLVSKDLNVGKEAFNNNVILYGIEQYYALISDD